MASTMLLMGCGKSAPASGGGGGSWVAGDHGTVVYWGRFTDPTKVRDSGGDQAADAESIDTLNDSSASAYNVQQTTSGYRPTCYTNIVNGKQIARFDGGDGFGLSNAQSGGISKNRAGLTFAFVAKLASVAAAQRIIHLYGPSATRVMLYLLGTTGNLGVTVRPQDGGSENQLYGNISYLPDTTNWWVWTVKLDFSGNACKAWLNDDLIIDDSDIGSSGNSSNTDPTGGGDGNQLFFNYYGSAGVNGDVGELVVWDGALSDVTVGNIRDALYTEYAITP